MKTWTQLHYQTQLFQGTSDSPVYAGQCIKASLADRQIDGLLDRQVMKSDLYGKSKKTTDTFCICLAYFLKIKKQKQGIVMKQHDPACLNRGHRFVARCSNKQTDLKYVPGPKLTGLKTHQGMLIPTVLP